MDHRRPPARAARRHHSPSRRRETPAEQPRKAQRSHSAIGASIVAAAAMLAVFAFILTRGSTGPTTDDGLRTGAVPNGAAAPADGVATPSADPSASTAKADRKPPPSTPAPKTRASTPAVNTGPTSPAFKRGQWIAVLDKYPTDVGLEADTLAKGTAAKLIAAGVPAKAMLVNGQYPGLADSSMEPITDSWVVYLGPGSSSEQVLDLCSEPKTQRAYSNPACPTYEPAAAPGS
ncbi:hypothetical protein E0H73_35550 [Kribbella pittospori]|uniref:Uncharacterized protein n=1 Tax=Kribbella pittospori TaxID=722689 RepID=A0A4R0K7N4_9ACTN|nr:hypothetical protein [Kribbella pittospori]TCC55257.1 hypothetical protein E0H73_35550 [Kribbella pittospori]